MDANEMKDKAQEAFETAKEKIGETLGAAKEKIDEIVGSEKFEEVSDKVIDGTAGVANKVTGDRYKEQIDGFATSADEKVGSADADPAAPAAPAEPMEGEPQV